MGRIEYRKGSLFEQDLKNTVLIHAVNCQGVWGGGIAATFRYFYPDAYIAYEKECNTYSPAGNLGTFGHFQTDAYNVVYVGWLFTSGNYGHKLDPEADILENTKQALINMMETLDNDSIEIHAPKINSGLFRVPWEKTEAIIEDVMKNYPNKFVVWVLE